jgi:hypothetical protein
LHEYLIVAFEILTRINGFGVSFTIEDCHKKREDTKNSKNGFTLFLTSASDDDGAEIPANA